MTVPYIVDHIPHNTPCGRRPGMPMNATSITIHNTGNEDSSAANERAWLTNTSNNRTASWHIVVDEHGAIEAIPLTENAWHAGDGGSGPGNRTSIGIEICESGDYAKALDNAAELVAQLLRERGWGVDRLRRHYDWSGKICPRLMYDGGRWTGWTAFKNLIAYKMLTNQKEDDTLNLTNYQWQTLEANVQKLVEAKEIDKSWLDKAKDRSLTQSELSWLNFILLTSR